MRIQKSWQIRRLRFGDSACTFLTGILTIGGHHGKHTSTEGQSNCDYGGC